MKNLQQDLSNSKRIGKIIAIILSAHIILLRRRPTRLFMAARSFPVLGSVDVIKPTKPITGGRKDKGLQYNEGHNRVILKPDNALVNGTWPHRRSKKLDGFTHRFKILSVYSRRGLWAAGTMGENSCQRITIL